ncbi:hypothetical protein [uncultured Meiothermus sp.]|nr:hypothetical protein [uncultured Meiothermus sp.]
MLTPCLPWAASNATRFTRSASPSAGATGVPAGGTVSRCILMVQ